MPRRAAIARIGKIHGKPFPPIPTACGLELTMQVWIGLKQGDAYVSEWTGEIRDEEEVSVAIGKAIADYRKKSGQAIWGMTIMVDRIVRQRQPSS